jgi:hypothetical protein
MKPWVISWAACCVLAPLVASGCSSGEHYGVAVSGNVTLDGKPLEDGAITLVPIEGTSGPTAGATITNGKFSVASQGGPVPGRYRVEISSFKDDPGAKNQQNAQMFGKSASDFPTGAAAQTIIRKNIIPQKYNDNSELKAEVPDRSSCELSFSLNR